MLTFRQRRSFSGKNNYLGHDFQRKLVWGAMLLIIGTILVGQSTGKIPSFEKLFRRRGPQEDNRVTADRMLSDPNARIPANKNVPQVAQRDDDAANPDRPAADTEGPVKPVATKKLFGGAKPQWFLNLDDDAVYRRDENDSFFSLLKLLSAADERDIRLASPPVRTFRQLYDQTDFYRGDLVTVEGYVARIIPATNPPPNEQGIKKYYEVWIEPFGNKVPIVAVCTEIPADYPTDAKDQIEVSVAGYFYKRLGYASNELDTPDKSTGRRDNVFRSSPLVLAKTLSWRRIAPAAPVEEKEDPATRLPFGIPRKYIFHVIGVGIALMIMISFWSYRMSRTSVLAHGPIVGRRRREAETEAEPTDLNNLRF